MENTNLKNMREEDQHNNIHYLHEISSTGKTKKDISSALNEDENGWCYLPDGGAYVSVDYVCKNVSLQSWLWYQEWYRMDDTSSRYKIGYPEGHLNYWNELTNGFSWSVEKWGLTDGMLVTTVGYDLDRELIDDLSEKTEYSIYRATTYLCRVNGSSVADAPVYMTRIDAARTAGKSTALKSRVWIGYGVGCSSGLLEKIQFPGGEINEVFVKKYVEYLVNELASLEQVINRLYVREIDEKYRG